MTRVHFLASAGLAVCLSGMFVAADEPLPIKRPSEKADPYYPPNVSTEAEKLEYDLRHHRFGDAEGVKKFRDAFPFVSLEDRLKFDGPGRKRVDKSLPAADLEVAKWKPFYSTPDKVAQIPPATLSMIVAEQRLKHEEYFDRTQALASLHKLEVRKFVTNPGFGHVRLMNRDFLYGSENQPKDWSEGDRGEAVTLPTKGTFFTPNEDKKGPTLPAVSALSHFHSDASHEFARPDSWGLVKDKKAVAGFKPHTLAFAPDHWGRQRRDEKNPTKDKDGKITGYPLVERWAVRKVELIGLLMHDNPVVYINEGNKLPSMAAVKEAKTRELERFETDALKELAAGKEAVHVAATVNQVRMVGAIRMAEACMKCHEGKQGDLLGAFTYDLVRDPAFVPSQK